MKEQTVFDPTSAEALSKVAKGQSQVEGRATIRPMHPRSPFYGKLGTAIYYHFDSSTYGMESYERYADEPSLQANIKGMVAEYKEALKQQKVALTKELREANRDKLPKYLIDEIQNKLNAIADNNIIAFKHEAYGYYKKAVDAENDENIYNIRDFVSIRTFPSVDTVEELNAQAELQDTAYGPIYFKWIIV